jgi:hypothetical protein
MSTRNPAPRTALAFLLGDAEGADDSEVLASELGEHDVAASALRGARRFSGPVRRAVEHELATVATSLLDHDLGDAVISAWRTWQAMTDAAQRTLATPGSEEVVVLATHRVTWTCRPHLDVLVDDEQVTTLDFAMTVAFDLDGVVAVVRDGDLVALRGGDCQITATLTLDEATLAQRQGHMDAAVVVPVDPPVPLIGDAADAPGTRPAPPSPPPAPPPGPETTRQSPPPPGPQTTRRPPPPPPRRPPPPPPWPGNRPTPKPI